MCRHHHIGWSAPSAIVTAGFGAGDICNYPVFTTTIISTTSNHALYINLQYLHPCFRLTTIV